MVGGFGGQKGNDLLVDRESMWPPCDRTSIILALFDVALDELEFTFRINSDFYQFLHDQTDSIRNKNRNRTELFGFNFLSKIYLIILIFFSNYISYYL